MSGGVGTLEGPAGRPGRPLPSRVQRSARGAEPVQPVKSLGDAEVSASGRRTKGSLERAGPEVPRPAPRLRDFIAPTPARDAVEYRSAPAPRQLPTLGIGCPSHTQQKRARRGGRARGRE